MRTVTLSVDFVVVLSIALTVIVCALCWAAFVMGQEHMEFKLQGNRSHWLSPGLHAGSWRCTCDASGASVDSARQHLDGVLGLYRLNDSLMPPSLRYPEEGGHDTNR